ncbi:MAG: protease SohB [marine bacterium B5-7]|nr:MAG: protease SohB [marine bacterium B5-7]
MAFLFEYGLFLAKAITLSVLVIVTVGAVLAMSTRLRGTGGDGIEITRLNDKYRDMTHALKSAISTKVESKQRAREEKKAAKKRAKGLGDKRGRTYVIDFSGDIRGTHVSGLREEITAILTAAVDGDEVIINVDSGGGMVNAYGLAASQLQRIRAREIPLTVCVDKVAASGGYLMACVANHIVAAPFAIIGSIGVIAQLPNVNKLLKKHGVEFEQIAAGEYKRTLTLFGENTDRDREKMQQDITETHELFKNFVSQHRPGLDIETVATGEYWLGTRAAELGLVDEIGTSDDLLLTASVNRDILKITYKPKQSLIQKISGASAKLVARLGARAPADDPHLLV